MSRRGARSLGAARPGRALALALLGAVWLALGVSAPARAGTPAAEQTCKRARAQASNKNWQGALTMLEPLLRDEVQHPDAVYLAGVCHLALDQREPAERWLRRITELKPDFFPGWQLLSTLYLKGGQLEQARQTLAALGRVAGGAAEAAYGFGVLAWRQQDLQGAEREWREALRLQPAMARAHSNLGILYRERSDRPRALASFMEAVRLDPDHPMYRYHLGALMLETGRRAEGMHHLDRVRAQLERRDVAQLALALQRLSHGHWQQAELAARKAREESPELTSALVLRARALEGLGRGPEARDLLLQALEEEPNLREAREALGRLPDPPPPPASGPQEAAPAQPSDPPPGPEERPPAPEAGEGVP